MNGVTMPYILRGSSALWGMPAAAQASILPLLMTCSQFSKLIQLVDRRQTDQPPPTPPSWMQMSPAAPLGPVMPSAPPMATTPEAPGRDGGGPAQRAIVQR